MAAVALSLDASELLLVLSDALADIFGGINDGSRTGGSPGRVCHLHQAASAVEGMGERIPAGLLANNRFDQADIDPPAVFLDGLIESCAKGARFLTETIAHASPGA